MVVVAKSETRVLQSLDSENSKGLRLWTLDDDPLSEIIDMKMKASVAHGTLGVHEGQRANVAVWVKPAVWAGG